MRIAIFGNSGSGKSTLARQLARERDLALLELDTIVWEPGTLGVRRAVGDAMADLERFVDGHRRWVVEGCFGEFVEAVLPDCTEVIFLNPGLSTCRENNLRRPWEPHKYDSPASQQVMLGYLLQWVEEYYARDDESSLAAHRMLFDSYEGSKVEITQLASIA